MRKNTLQPSNRKNSLTGSSQMAGLYDLEETLGKGHFAVVKAARHVFTQERVAVKVIDKTKLDAASQKSLFKEVLCMKLVQHQNVVRLYEVIDTATKMYLILELGRGDLYDKITSGGLTEEIARKYFAQIVAAVSYCHKLHVAHRDLKPENLIFFDTQDGGKVKLTDFGFSNKFCPGSKLDTACGSLAYSSPEILLGDAYEPRAVDIWSLGVILYMLVVGRAPFQEANDSETLTMILDVKYSIPPNVSQECRNLISRMLIRRPEQRATLDEIEDDPWLNKDGCLAKQRQIPLIVDYRLTPEERNSIIQQMISGQLATKDEIVEALQKNSYNHITSTFFLLAEKLLRDRSSSDYEDRPLTALTASLESLHDRRKNSGQSDNEEMGSGEEDSLAPLDLEKGASSRKSSRSSYVLSPSSINELDKALPILEEDATAHSEEEDSAGPLPVGANIRRRSYGNHRRVIVPQRSASCSSSEDEDSEKKKRSLPHRHKNKSSGRHNSDSEIASNRFRDDESSDEQSGGAVGPSGGHHSTTLTDNSNSQQHQHSDSNQGGGGGGRGGGDNNSSEKKNGLTSNDNDKNESENENVEILEKSWRRYNSNNNSESENEEKKTSLQLAYEHEYDFTRIVIEREKNSPVEDSSHCQNEDSRDSSHLNNNNNNYSFTSNPDDDHFKNNNNISAGSVNEHDHDNKNEPQLYPHHGLSVAKKGKKLFFSWFFLRRKRPSSKNNCLSVAAPSGGTGIYKTRSLAELKLKNASNGNGLGIGQLANNCNNGRVSSAGGKLMDI